MTEQTMRLMARFDLDDEVEKFVRAKVAELAGAKQTFSFRGSCRSCGNREPHVAHIHGEYDTVRYGRLDYFCLGVNGGGVEVVIEHRIQGCPDFPGRARGYNLIAACVAEGVVGG